MEERYTKIKVIEPSEDFLDCPVEIVKEAILFDNIEPVNVLQIKFKKLKDNILATIVSIECFNSVGERLNENSIEYSYGVMDESSEFFGSKQAINLNLTEVFDVRVKISKVVLKDGSTWVYKDGCMITPPKQDRFSDYNLKNQLQRDQGRSFADKMKYYPVEYENMWQCSCSKLNTGEECISCGYSKERIFKSINNDTLKENLKKYLVEEEKRREEERQYEAERLEKQRKNNVKKFILVLSFIVIFIVCSNFISKSVEKSNLKQRGETALEEGIYIDSDTKVYYSHEFSHNYLRTAEDGRWGVYDYYIDDDLRIWYKIYSDDGYLWTLG